MEEIRDKYFDSIKEENRIMKLGIISLFKQGKLDCKLKPLNYVMEEGLKESDFIEKSIEESLK